MVSNGFISFFNSENHFLMLYSDNSDKTINKNKIVADEVESSRILYFNLFLCFLVYNMEYSRKHIFLLYLSGLTKPKVTYTHKNNSI